MTEVDRTRSALVLGGTGAIGARIARRLETDGMEVAITGRDPGDLESAGRLDAVVWAQGTNVNDSVTDLDPAVHEEVLRGNVLFVSLTMARLLAAGAIADGARLCVVSSIWELAARPGKFSYTISKAAIGGLVRSAAVDLAERGVLVNAVLPGVVDTPMTREMLAPGQVERAAGATGFGRLVALEDVATLVAHLVSPANTGVTGQSIAVDLGFTVRHDV
jgi:NAD(P)-dependent dehydrogenase (short-subunit alcohol dehydrogenase family)